LSNLIVELLNTYEANITKAREQLRLGLTIIGDAQKSLGSALLCLLIGQVPDGILQRELLLSHCPDFWQDPNFEITHRKEKLRVVLRKYADKGVFPFVSDRGRLCLMFQKTA
jgi:hypothetical protein